MGSRARNTKRGVFLLLVLSLGFMGVFLTTIYHGRNWSSTRATALQGIVTLAKFASELIPSRELDQLADPILAPQPSLEKYKAKIEEFRESVGYLDEVVIYAPIGKEIRAILSSGEPGAERFDVVDAPRTELQKAFRSNHVEVAIDEVDGIFFAYAPIGEKGSSRYVISVRGSAAKLIPGLEENHLILVTFLVAGVMFAVGLAWLVASLINSSDPESLGEQGLTRPLAEIFLFAATLLVLTDGTLAALDTFRISQQQKQVGLQLQEYRKLHEAVYLLKHGKRGEVFNKEGEVIFAGLTTSESIDKLRLLQATHEPKDMEQVVEFADEQTDLLFGQVAILNQEASEGWTRMSRVFMIALLLAGASGIILRYAASQNHKLNRYQSQHQEARAIYRHVVESMPVGLFMFREGKFVFANRELKSQIDWKHDDSEELQIDGLLHADDAGRMLETLQEATDEAKPFRLEYRRVNAMGRTIHMESRGVPILAADGTCEQVLGFTLDVTPMAEAREALQRTFAEVQTKNELLSSALSELEANLENVVRSLVRAVEAKDPYTAGHSERVMQYSLWLGEAVGLGSYDLRVLELGCLVHDVGKIGTPDAILTKPGKLTDEEFDQIKMHPVFGVKIIESIPIFRECIPIVRWHHEKLTGTGYPDKLKGDEIPYLVRVSTIADIFDAMTSTRAYRAGMEISKVLGIMQGLSDAGEIDDQLFAVFCHVIADKGVIPQNQVNDAAA
ncbi:MAG: HD domain-containing protein [Fimbriimonadaceae bacterium]|jgi:PAS domain S-box-containing protein|nr:HD domain-containing protein [Fimbriimonadaceae bacterium]